MDDIINRLLEVIKISGLSDRKFAAAIGLSASGLNGIIKKRTKKLTPAILKVIQYRYNVNPQWLLTGQEPMYGKNFIVEDPVEIDHISKFRLLDGEQKRSVILMTKALYEQKYPQKSSSLKVADRRPGKYKPGK